MNIKLDCPIGPHTLEPQKTARLEKLPIFRLTKWKQKIDHFLDTMTSVQLSF